MIRFVARDLWRNPRRTLAGVLGVVLGVGLFSGVLFFADASAATMTRRAVSMLSLDVQAVLESPLGPRLRFEERVSVRGRLSVRQRVTFTLTVVNNSPTAVHEIVINDEPPPPLTYVPNTTTLNGQPLADPAGQSPLAQGLARSGLNVGALPAGGSIRLTFAATADRTVESVDALRLRGTVSSRESLAPEPANRAEPLDVEQIGTRIGRIAGVKHADPLSFVDLASGSAKVGRRSLLGPIRLFAFDRAYQQHQPMIRLLSGEFGQTTMLTSAEAARALGAKSGDVLELILPGRSGPLRMRIGGVVDLKRADALFTSRKARKLDEVLYVPFSLVVPRSVFASDIVPAFRSASAAPGSILKNFPVSEIDVSVDRSRLPADPGGALLQTQAIARAMRLTAPTQLSVIDNISNALQVADEDAAVGKRMFLFLGLPSMLLAALLAVFAANVQAEAQRRDHATLRLHGADAAFLARLLVLRTAAISGVGSIAGTGLGVLSAAAVLGPRELRAATPSALAISCVASIASGVLITGFALYTRGRQSLRYEVVDQRKDLAVTTRPLWHRFRVDVVLLAIAAFAVVVEARTSRPSTASTSAGRAVTLPLRLLFAPMAIWLGGSLLVVRFSESLTSRLPLPASSGFGPLVRGTLTRGIRRRSRSLVTATLGATAVVAFGTNLVVFAATYDTTKAEDARFAVGADLRITPGVESGRPHRSDSSTFEVTGVTGSTPVVFRPENSVLIGPFNQDRADLVAIEPLSFERVAALQGARIVDSSLTEALDELNRNPRGLLVQSSRADDLSIGVGDRVEVLLARGTARQKLESFRVVALFVTFPGFPQGVDLVANLGLYESATGSTEVDWFLARSTGPGGSGVDRAVEALRAGPGAVRAIAIETAATTLNRDQTSLTAVNVRGLLELASMMSLAIGTSVIATFVFGQLLTRRREYVALRASGLSVSRLLALVLGESMVVAIVGLVAGLIIGIVESYVFVRVLRPLFFLDPKFKIPLERLAFGGAGFLGATVVASLAATAMLGRRSAVIILRDQ